MSDLRRPTRYLCISRAVLAAVFFVDLATCAFNLASGQPGLALLIAAFAALAALAVVVQTVTIRRARATLVQVEAKRSAPAFPGTTAGLELGFARLSATLGPCSHPDAEPVDLSTGERVAWVCPDCDAELPAGWTPQAKGTGGGGSHGDVVIAGAGEGGIDESGRGWAERHPSHRPADPCPPSCPGYPPPWQEGEC